MVIAVWYYEDKYRIYIHWSVRLFLRTQQERTRVVDRLSHSLFPRESLASGFLLETSDDQCASYTHTHHQKRLESLWSVNKYCIPYNSTENFPYRAMFSARQTCCFTHGTHSSQFNFF